MAIVSPSILSADFGKLGADCRMVLDAGAQMLHYDVMDGHFVPNISFGVPVLKSLHKALPDAFYDVHLMISHPLQYAEPFIKAGATLYNFHLECEDDIQATIDAVRALGCICAVIASSRSVFFFIGNDKFPINAKIPARVFFPSYTLTGKPIILSSW